MCLLSQTSLSPERSARLSSVVLDSGKRPCHRRDVFPFIHLLRLAAVGIRKGEEGLNVLVFRCFKTTSRKAPRTTPCTDGGLSSSAT